MEEVIDTIVYLMLCDEHIIKILIHSKCAFEFKYIFSFFLNIQARISVYNTKKLKILQVMRENEKAFRL